MGGSRRHSPGRCRARHAGISSVKRLATTCWSTSAIESPPDAVPPEWRDNTPAKGWASFVEISGEERDRLVRKLRITTGSARSSTSSKRPARVRRSCLTSPNAYAPVRRSTPGPTVVTSRMGSPAFGMRLHQPPSRDHRPQSQRRETEPLADAANERRLHSSQQPSEYPRPRPCRRPASC